MRSLLRYGLEALGFADTLCSAVLTLLNMAILPLTVSFTSVRNCCIASVISCLDYCWNVTISAVVTMSVHNSAAAGAAAFEDVRALPLVMSLNDAPLPCRMQLCYVSALSARECVVASVTSAAEKCAKCMGAMYIQTNI